MDHLNADLWIQNEASEAKAKKKRKPAPKKTHKKKKKKKVDTDSGFHFIAYVPSGGSVWELDGLKSKPLHLGIAAPRL